MIALRILQFEFGRCEYIFQIIQIFQIIMGKEQMLSGDKIHHLSLKVKNRFFGKGLKTTKPRNVFTNDFTNI